MTIAHVSPWQDAITSGLSVLRVVLGAALLSVIAYRIYFTRPQRDVPVTDAEIAAYKRTGRHDGGSGYSGYQMSLAGGHPRAVAGLVLVAGAMLTTTIVIERPHHHHAALGLACAALGLYSAALAGLLLHEARVARHGRVRRLLAAMDLPASTHVLCVETQGGLLAMAAARGDYKVTVLVRDDTAALERTRINLRRANLAHRVAAVTELPQSFDAVLSTAPFVTPLPIGILQSRATGRRLPPSWADQALGVLTLGLVQPGARWR